MRKLWYFLNFFPKCARARIFSRHIFPAHFVGFLFSFFFFFLAFSFVFSTLSRKWRRTLFVLELRHLFLRYSVHLVKEIVKLLKKSERWENKWSKVKTLQDKPRSRWLVFLTKCVKNVIEKAVSHCTRAERECCIMTD